MCDSDQALKLNAVGLTDNPMRHAIAEGSPDRWLVGQEAIARNLR
jgi:post-segregation antitoxin (ccd killing protein)